MKVYTAIIQDDDIENSPTLLVADNAETLREKVLVEVQLQGMPSLDANATMDEISEAWAAYAEETDGEYNHWGIFTEEFDL